MSATKFSAVRGMNDLLPADAPRWERFERHAVCALRSYGYAQLRTPIVEATGVFRRGLGAATDIVEKEMYSFTDSLNGEELTLRPENTAGVVRAAIEHNLLYNGPRRLWTYGPVFRHERPQRGRYRQFYQVGAEALGFAEPEIEAEQLLMLHRLWQTLDVGPLRLLVNSLGQPEERARHRDALVRHLQQHRDLLNEDGQRRIESNPLRVLDSKHAPAQQMLAAAPRLLDTLGEASARHFERVCALLQSAGVAYEIDPRLVRGMDYYNLTVFEWVTDRLGAQGTICGGGRYDGLFELLGGRPTPACGFSIGAERVIELMGSEGDSPEESGIDAYVLHQGGATLDAAFALAERLREAGLEIELHAGAGSMKSQMKKADASGAQFAVIVGEREHEARSATVKSLRGGSVPEGTQELVPWDAVAEHIIDAFE
jgi:histidyl-tRNA synthetase